MGRLARLLCLLTFTAGPLAALDLAMPNGSRQTSVSQSPLDSYALPIGPFSDGAVPFETFEGAVTREVWRIDTESITNLQVVQPLRDGLVEIGYEIALDCDDRACGGFDFRFNTEVLPAPDMFVDLTDFHALSARRGTEAVNVLVSGTQAARFIQLIRVGAAEAVAIAPAPVALARPVSRADPTPLEPIRFDAMLEAQGRVILDDLNFESGSATLSDGPYGSLEALADYLISRPDRQVALVGHTDAVGALEGNIALSRRRAEAVVERLVDSYNVPRGQLDAGGMGYLAPRTTNLTAEGRALNRRVEVILTSTE